jgi:hypothetical protein
MALGSRTASSLGGSSHPWPPPLYATAETASAIAEAKAVALMIGGYDGSGNYGDLVQLDAAAELLEPLAPGLLALPVVERQYAGSHRMLVEQMLHPPEQVLFFDARGQHEDDLVPVEPPYRIEFGACYLYGGGYLNGLWGGRKLAMLRAAESLLAAGDVERVCRISSGLQADPDWVEALGGDDGTTLRGLELHAGRDPRSSQVLDGLGGAPVLLTGDDAVGVLGRLLVPGPLPAVDGELRVAVHYTDHDWVTDDASRLLAFYLEMLNELGRTAGAAVRIQPLVAYLDHRVDERPAAELLASACAERGIEVAEPIVLRPAGLATAAGEIRRASLTITCSYHVALTSLMLGVPAVSMADTPYYEQKATGLLDGFDLPPDFTARSSEDAAEKARTIAPMVLDPGTAADLHHRLARDARLLHRRRQSIEAELLHRLAAARGGLADDAGDPAGVDPLTTAVQRDADRRILLAERRARAAEQRARAAEQRARAVELEGAALRAQVSALVGSRSWALTAPVRRLGALVRGARSTGRG